MYVLKEKPAIYADIHKDPSVPWSVTIWKSWLKPLSLLAAGGVLGGAFFHYMIHGPKTPHEDTNGHDAGKTEGGK